MQLDRRRFLQVSSGALAACWWGRAPARSHRALRVLVLGGTGFLGPHIVRAAQQREFTITLFNRGRTNPELFPDLEKLRGDRNGDLSALAGREFDVVIDSSGTTPAQVRRSAPLLGGCSQYVFLSTINVYRDFTAPG